MKYRPIIMRADEVRAILDGRKTQFRRPIKPQPVLTGFPGPHWPEHPRKPWMPVGGVYQDQWQCPHGQPGDRLWVRETWRKGAVGTAAEYWATVDALDWALSRWSPSVHMPRWASRITLEIVRVRVERVQDITEEDAINEGCVRELKLDGSIAWGVGLIEAREEFRNLWQSIHGTWDANPWVWVVEFRRVTK